MLSLSTPAAMKKYKLEKQGVYDRRFALNKKLKEAGLSIEEVLNNNENAEQPAPKKARAKKAPSKVEPVVEESSSREVMAINRAVPVLMKPIEINFENFSIKLNGVPKKISVNPETNAIEIDL